MKKIITIFTCAFLMAMIATLTAFGAGWEQNSETGVWSFTDKEGEKVANKWQKSGENWYWLNEDGNMVVAQLIDDGEYLYCVDETGKMIKSNWVKVNNDTFADKWLYFGSNGRAYKDGWKGIKDERYHFTEYAMDERFLDENGAMIDKDNDEAWKDAVYYVGDSGNMRKNYWLQVDSIDAADGKDWIFFGSNGKKVVSCQKVINGATYVFDANGAIKTSFINATISTVPVTEYLDDNGKMLKKGWVYTFLNEDADEKNWFYALNSGELVKGVVKTINNKKYAFDAEGRMLTGFVQVNPDTMAVESVGYAAEDVTFAKATSDLGSRTFMYFTENEDPNLQGAALKGKQTIACEEGNLVINFSSQGFAKGTDGKFVIKNGYAFINSVLYARDDVDYKYEVIMDENGDFYVLTVKSGKASKKGTFTDSANDIRYTIKDGVVTIEKKNNAGKWIAE